MGGRWTPVVLALPKFNNANFQGYKNSVNHAARGNVKVLTPFPN